MSRNLKQGQRNLKSYIILIQSLLLPSALYYKDRKLDHENKYNYDIT